MKLRYRLKVEVPRILAIKIIGIHELSIFIFSIARPKINDWNKPITGCEMKVANNSRNERKKASTISVLADDVDGALRLIYNAIL